MDHNALRGVNFAAEHRHECFARGVDAGADIDLDSAANITKEFMPARAELFGRFLVPQIFEQCDCMVGREEQDGIRPRHLFWPAKRTPALFDMCRADKE